MDNKRVEQKGYRSSC